MWGSVINWLVNLLLILGILGGYLKYRELRKMGVDKVEDFNHIGEEVVKSEITNSGIEKKIGGLGVSRNMSLDNLSELFALIFIFLRRHPIFATFVGGCLLLIIAFSLI